MKRLVDGSSSKDDLVDSIVFDNGRLVVNLKSDGDSTVVETIKSLSNGVVVSHSVWKPGTFSNNLYGD